MATFTVTTLSDSGAGSLRAVLVQANAAAGADNVVFAANLEGGTLVLTRGELDIASDVTIDGDRNNDGREVQISGNNASRVIDVVGSGTDARLVDLTIADGSTYGAVDGEQGAGIRLGAGQALSLEGCTVTGNATATYSEGGGIFVGAGGRVSVAGSTISRNFADTGGGVYLSEGASATIATSRVTGNAASDLSSSGTGSGGGGMALQNASLVLTRSTVDGNSADFGAGVLSTGSQLTIQTSTIAENSTAGSLFGGSGAGLSLSGGYAFLANSTVSNNRIGRYDANDRDTSAGIDVGGATVSLANTIVGSNYQGTRYISDTPSDVRGTIAFSNGHNVFTSAVAGSVAGDVEDAGTILRLSDNGGPTPTVPSRGLDDSSGGEPVASGAIDQRGFARPVPTDSNPDVGALEGTFNVSREPSAFNDALAGTAGGETIAGLAGADLILGRGGDDRLFGGSGGDTLVGSDGADLLDGDVGLDTGSYRDATGAVTASLAAGTASGAAGADRLFELENLEGGRFADSLTGSGARNWLGGRDGDDHLFGLGGDDVLLGGVGNDRLTGGAGRDRLESGTGSDLFDFDSVGQSPAVAGRTACDTITDFNATTDRIDLATIDARSATAGTNDGFTFLAARGAAFTAAGQVRWLQDDGCTFVEASTDGDAAAELQIRLTGLTTLGAGDFVL